MTDPKENDQTGEMKTPRQCCQNCHHFKVKLADVANIKGECRRYPPHTELMLTPKGPIPVSFWPGPPARDYCGEFKWRLSL